MVGEREEAERHNPLVGSNFKVETEARFLAYTCTVPLLSLSLDGARHWVGGVRVGPVNVCLDLEVRDGVGTPRLPPGVISRSPFCLWVTVVGGRLKMKVCSVIVRNCVCAVVNNSCVAACVPL